MHLAVLIILSISLAMDAFAVAIVNGISIKNIRITQAIVIALFFGVFQAVMPVIGWFIGIGVKNIISGVDHWIIFCILSFIGAKMIYESFKQDKDNTKKQNSYNFHTLFILATATSIDALAVGVGFSFIKMGIVLPASIIGVITFLLSFTGVYIGKKAGKLFGQRMEAVGGLILIIIGLTFLF